jgi:amino acid adenylation domain-containing protein
MPTEPATALTPEAKRALLSGLLERRAKGAAAAAVPTADRSGRLALSCGQRRLWFADQLAPGGRAYNVHVPMRMAGPLRVAPLEMALSELVRRHEALRTTFAAHDGTPYQVIQAPGPVAVPVVDLAGLPPARRDEELKSISNAQVDEPFDLARGPLFRTCLLRLEADVHVLLLTYHHIVGDAQSAIVFWRELGALYDAFARDQPASLPELALQFADFAAWEHTRLQGLAFQDDFEYWRRQLAGLQPLTLPTDRPRPATPSFRGANATRTVGASLSAAVKDLGRQCGATLPMTLFAAFAELLRRYSAQDDVAIGWATANRSRAEFERILGFFVNTLVMRVDLAGNPSVRDLLGRVRQVALDAYQHQELPFDVLVEELQPARRLNHHPLFQVVFSFESLSTDTAPASLELAFEHTELDTESTRFDLEFYVRQQGDGLFLKVCYSTDLFDRGTIDLLLERYEALLLAMSEAVDAPASTLAAISARERRLVVDEWNRTGAAYPDTGIAAVFEEQASRTPLAIAVECGADRLTYADLNARANRIAHYLAGAGVGPETLVGVSLDRSIDLIAALVGILKAGGVYVPLDPSYPADRLAFMIKDTAAPLVLTSSTLRETFDQLDGAATTICLDAIAADLAARPGTNPVRWSSLDRLAYVTYTSGSTGVPKGVAVTERGVLRLVFGGGFAALGPEQAILQLAPVAFDASTLEIWGALLHGARLIVYPERVPVAPELGRVVAAHGVTTAWLTASLFNSIVDELPGALGPLRQILTGGEALSVPHVTRAQHALASTRLINGYGPTESTTFACCHAIPPLTGAELSVPIGRPIGNTQAYVLDASFSPVAVGVPGELFIGGDGLARGYWRRPALTAERFVPNPFAPAGSRLYRTGDRVRWLADGTLEFLGRFDDQVKIHGFRIEPGEIEALLARHPAVGDVAVLARQDTPGDRRLVAYVVGRGGRTDGALVPELRRYLSGRLPEYMVPSAFVLIDALPLTPNGKVDRHALPAPDQSRPHLTSAFVAPRNAVEEALAGIWRTVLTLDQVGVHDDFFEAGGHSLLATQIISRVRNLFAVELPLRALFEAPTVAGLAAVVESEARREPAAGDREIRPAPRTGTLPLSVAQERLWLVDQLDPGNAAYNMPGAFRLRGPLDVPSLASAIREVVRRHEPLRTRFPVVDGRPCQHIDPAEAWELAVVDLRAEPRDAREAAALRLAREDAHIGFDLENGPLFRASLALLDADDHLLILNAHHSVCDGWSIAIFMRELAVLHETVRTGRPSGLAVPPVQYVDYAVWQRERLDRGVLAPSLEYWETSLAGAKALELPGDRPRPAVRTSRGAVERLPIPQRVVSAARALGQREGATLYMTMLAAFAALLGRRTGQEDFTIGSATSGRGRREIEDLIGFFVNTIVFRFDLGGNPTFRELVARVRATALQAWLHQDVPFDKVVEAIGVPRDPSRNPLFQVLFNLFDLSGAPVTLSGVDVEPLPIDHEASKFDLTLFLYESADALTGVFTYNPDLFDAATVRRLARQFERLLGAALQEPDRRLSELTLTDDAERAELIGAFNDSLD